jgi:hypothetical protein
VRAIRVGVSMVALCWSAAGSAALTCSDVEQFLYDKAVGVTCVHSSDLRTNNPATTPANNAIVTFADGTPLPGLGGFTPTTDRGVISNGPAPSAGPVPGIQVSGWFADDPTKQARFLLRFPDDWNGKLVVAGASGTRSEFNGDWAWSDYVLPKGYAYASQNKGVLNLYVAGISVAQPPGDPLSCRLNPVSPVWVHFYDNDAGKEFTQWTLYMLKTASLAQHAAKASYQRFPRRTYAVGTSNGGYQVRRAMEEAPDLFDGGVDWEGTFIDPRGPNILIDLPPAIRNFPAYVASGYDKNSAAAKAIVAAGYPPDIVNRDAGGAFLGSLWKRYYDSFWEVTACQWQKRFDPSYPTYVAGLDNYDYLARLKVPGVFADVAAVQTTGKIKKPLVTVAGTMDALLPPERHARAYERAVNASRKGNNDHRNAQFRLYEVQNGNHIEDYVGETSATGVRFTQLQLIQPHAQKAFDVLVDHVESNVSLPPSQCIAKGASISSNPTRPGHCAALFAP